LDALSPCRKAIKIMVASRCPSGLEISGGQLTAQRRRLSRIECG
jgi:hypothetical protein